MPRHERAWQEGTGVHTRGHAALPRARAARAMPPSGRPIGSRVRARAPIGRPIPPAGRPIGSGGRTMPPAGRPIRSGGPPMPPSGRTMPPSGRSIGSGGRPMGSRGRTRAPVGRTPRRWWRGQKGTALEDRRRRARSPCSFLRVVHAIARARAAALDLHVCGRINSGWATIRAGPASPGHLGRQRCVSGRTCSFERSHSWRGSPPRSRWSSRLRFSSAGRRTLGGSKTLSSAASSSWCRIRRSCS